MTLPAGTTLSFYHPDHLGSINLITDHTGKQVELAEYKPFGSFSRLEKGSDAGSLTTASPSGSDPGFTGKRLDSTTGLYYYGARYYDPELGRFTQPDTIVQPRPGSFALTAPIPPAGAASRRSVRPCANGASVRLAMPKPMFSLKLDGMVGFDADWSEVRLIDEETRKFKFEPGGLQSMRAWERRRRIQLVRNLSGYRLSWELKLDELL